MLDNCLICTSAPALIEYVVCEKCWNGDVLKAKAAILHNFNRRLKEIERLHTDNKSLKDCKIRYVDYISYLPANGEDKSLPQQEEIASKLKALSLEYPIHLEIKK